MVAVLNNSIKYSSTTKAPTQVLYRFRTREALDLLRINDSNDSTLVTVVAFPVTRSAARRAAEPIS